MTIPEVETVYGEAGRAETATDPARLPMIETTIQLKPRDEWRPGVTMDSLKAELNALVDVPSLTNVWIMPIKNRLDMLATGIKTPVGVKVADPDLNVIAEVGRDIENVLQDVGGTASVYAERVIGGRFIDVDINREAAARFGLNIADIHDIVRTAIGGMTIFRALKVFSVFRLIFAIRAMCAIRRKLCVNCRSLRRRARRSPWGVLLKFASMKAQRSSATKTRG